MLGMKTIPRTMTMVFAETMDSPIRRYRAENLPKGSRKSQFFHFTASRGHSFFPKKSWIELRDRSKFGAIFEKGASWPARTTV